MGVSAMRSRMMRHLLLLVGAVAGASAARAQAVQQAGSPSTVAGPLKLRVYLADFQQDGAGPNGVNVAEFARTLARLQLMGVRGVQVMDASGKMPCANQRGRETT